MIIISIVSGKGGVAKTTTSCNLSAGLATMGKKVLLVDIDKQSHSSIQFNKFNCNLSINDVIEGINPVEIIQKTSIEGIDILPSNKRIRSVKDSIDCLTGLKSLDYDFIIIDCPPSLGRLTENALIISDYVLVPLIADRWGMEGLSDVTKKIEDIRDKYNSKLRLLGVFLAKDEKSAMTSRIKTACKKSLQELFFDASIRTSKLVSKSSFTLPVVIKYPKSNVSCDYKAFTNEVLKKCS
jgi:chromosome partitioning protein